MISTRQNIHVRVARELAKHAHGIAKRTSLGLPKLFQAMVKVIRIGTASVNQEKMICARYPAAANLDTYEPRYWAETMPSLDAEVAIALLHQTIADDTTWRSDVATRSQS